MPQALLHHLNTALPGIADKLGVSADWLARLSRATASLDFALAYQAALKNAAEGASALKNAVIGGPVTGGLSAHPLTRPSPPDGPLFEDATGFLGELIAYLKGLPGYNDAIGQTLDILPKKAAPVDLDSLQPDLSYKLTNGQPYLDWSKAGTDALEIEVDRGAGQFALLTIDTSPGYLDAAPLPTAGTAARWRYRAIYRIKDQRVGQWSAVVDVAVMGG
jgi:hypothetical protein